MKLSELQLDYPTKIRTIVQGFSDNMEPGLYGGQGLISHSAIDFGANYGDDITSSSKGIGRVYKKYNEGNPDLTKYRAVCEIVDLDDCSIEITYGHCSRTDTALGEVSIGQYLGKVGNTGDVYAGNRYVTAIEKNLGSHAGSHLHFQVRYLTRTFIYDNKRQYIADSDGIPYKYNGQYYLIPDYSKGHNGCIDPLPFLLRKLSDLTPDQAVVIQTEITQAKTLLDRLIEWWNSIRVQKS